MIKDKKVIAVIPARGGSKGLPRKNVKLLAGKPLIAYTIFAAKNSKLVDRVFVSTEDKEIADVAKEYGAEVMERPESLAGDLIPTAPVLKDLVEQLERKEGYHPDIVVYLQPTDIFRKKGVIDEVIERFVGNPGLDSVFAAYPTHKNFWKRSDEKYKRIIEDTRLVRQVKEPIWREDTGIASAIRPDLIKQGIRIGDKVEIVDNETSLSFIDVHDADDLRVSELIIEDMRKSGKIKEYELF